MRSGGTGVRSCKAFSKDIERNNMFREGSGQSIIFYSITMAIVLRTD